MPARDSGSGGMPATAPTESRKLGVNSVPTPAPVATLLGVEASKGVRIMVVDAGLLCTGVWPRQPNAPIQPAMARPIWSGESSWR
jgi:hypothetical protein